MDLGADPVKLLFKDISKYPVLSDEETKKLAKKIKELTLSKKEPEKLKKYLHKMVNSNLRLVASIAKEYQNQGLFYEEIISEGYNALIRAAELYDYTKGASFSTYASIAIERGIKRGINKMAHNTISLDELVNDTEKNTRIDLTPDAKSKDPSKIIFSMDRDKTINRILSKLPKKEREVMEFRLGTNGESPLTLKETGKRLGISKEKTRLKQEKALIKLQKMPEYKELIAEAFSNEE